jgi:hypothetical protein
MGAVDHLADGRDVASAIRPGDGVLRLADGDRLRHLVGEDRAAASSAGSTSCLPLVSVPMQAICVPGLIQSAISSGSKPR